MEKFSHWLTRLGRIQEDDPYDVILFRQTAITAALTIIFVYVYYWTCYQLYDTPQALYNAQKQLSHAYALTLGLQILAVMFFKRKELVRGLYKALLQPASANNLAVFRIFIMYIFIRETQGVYYNYSFWINIPDAQRVSLPFMGWLVHTLPISPLLYNVAYYACLLAGIFAMIGLYTRPALIAYTVLVFYVGGVPNFFGKINHNQILVWIPAILATAPCGDALSIDSWLKKRKTPAPSAVYGFPLKVVGLLLGVLYFDSGLHKIWDNGLHWALSESSWNQFRMEWFEHYDKVPFFRIDHYPLLCRAGGMAVIGWEMGYIFMLFHPRLKPLALLGGVIMHGITHFFLYILFVAVLAAYVSQIDWDGLYRKIRKKAAPTPEAVPRLPGKEAWIVAGVLLFVNLYFGIVQIHSWPFSAYPSYSNLAPAQIQYVTFEAVDSTGKSIDVLAEAKNAKFRKENYRTFEDRMIWGLKLNPDTNLTANVEKYWKVWQEKAPALKNARLAAAYLDETSLEPEKRKILLSRKKLWPYEK